MAAANPTPHQSSQDADDNDHHHMPRVHLDEEEEEEIEYEDDDVVTEHLEKLNYNNKNNNGGHVATTSFQAPAGNKNKKEEEMGRRRSELTLAFEGEVYVFPAVTPDKVQTVLLLLGGRQIPTNIPNNNTVVDDVPKRCNLSRRIASLVRFREKRKERCFDKKIRYTVRKEVAQRMHRKNGQFASLKEGSGSSNWDSGKSSPQGDATHRPESVLRKCHHCGVSENSTPAMRRGPAGPRTLCNACGLMWANKGTLRDLRKGGRNHAEEQIEPGTPFEIRPLLYEGKQFPSNQDDPVTPEDPSKVLTEETSNHTVDPDKQFCGRTEVLTSSLPIGMVVSPSGTLDQDTLVEFANVSETDMDITTNFE